MPTTHSSFMTQSSRESGDFELVVADLANARIA